MARLCRQLRNHVSQTSKSSSDDKFDTKNDTCQNPIRFAIISILFTSPPDLYTLVLAFTLQFLVIVAGSGSEALWATGADKSKTYANIVFGAAFACYATPWIVLYVIFKMSIDAKVTEDSCGVAFLGEAEKQDPPDFVWVAVIGLFVTFTSFAVAHFFKIRKPKDDKHCLEYEFVYSFLSFTSKIILLANIAGGILGRSENNVTQADRPNGVKGTDTVDLNGGDDNDETAEVWMYFGTALIISLILGIALFWRARMKGLFKKSDDSGAVEVMMEKKVLMRAAGLVF